MEVGGNSFSATVVNDKVVTLRYTGLLFGLLSPGKMLSGVSVDFRFPESGTIDRII